MLARIEFLLAESWHISLSCRLQGFSAARSSYVDNSAPPRGLIFFGSSELPLLNCRFRDMMSRHCANRIFLSGGSNILHGLKSRGRATRRHSAVRFRRCCVRANFWRTDHLPVKVTPSEVILNFSFPYAVVICLLLYC